MPNTILWTSEEAEAVTGGKSSCAWNATGISMSMDSLKPGDLYIATREDNLDAVFQGGAAAAVISSRNNYVGEYPVLRVGAVFEALQCLAKAARFKTHAHIIAVQSRSARLQLHETLQTAGRVYEGGRHLSLGLAGLPEMADFGVFGFSPFLQPDITVISEFGSRQYEMVLETMPVHGALILNCDDPVHIDVIARARACGVENIITYGRNEMADARIINTLKASNGARVYAKIFNEDKVFTIPGHHACDPNIILSLLVMKITERSMRAKAQIETQIEQQTSQVSNLSLFDSVTADIPAQAVFRVTNMIDLGLGRQTAILDNLANFSQKSLCFPEKDLAIPRSLEGFDLMYTGRTTGAVRDAQNTLQSSYRNARVEEISPEALAPGDFVVFKDIRDKSRAVFSEALRLINPRRTKANYAV